MCQDLPGYENYTNHQLQELSYSSDRNYFCQPYIGFVPESQEFKNVRKEMVRYSNKSAKVSTSVLNIFIFVKLREREGQGVDQGRSLKGHL